MTTSWRFDKIRPGTKQRNPVQDEFFNSSEALTEISSLVRESVQNSLDAQMSNIKEPVKLIFTVGDLNNRTILKKYFVNLAQHVNEIIPNGLTESSESKCHFLVIEDFNTSGLLGHSAKAILESSENPSENSYHYFVWEEGGSAKTEGKRGRWGIGKIVFPRLSNIKSFFILTSRAASHAPCGRKEILIGMSILKLHNLNGAHYQPDGWWAGISEDGSTAIPVSEEMNSVFKHDWNLSRKNENGLSIVIPYIPEFITKEMVRDCVIRDYFIAIMQGLLQVEVRDEEGSIVLTRENLRVECARLGPDERISSSKSKDEMLFLIDMVGELNSDSIRPISIILPEGGDNKWNLVESNEELKELGLASLNEGQTVIFKVQVEISARDKLSKDDFYVLLKKFQESRTSAVFSREGIIIPSANPILIKDHLALVMISRGPLANLLADAEGPAHEKWSDKTDKFRAKYPSPKGGQVLTYLRKAPIELLSYLRGGSSNRDSSAFANFFPLSNRGRLKNSSQPNGDYDGESKTSNKKLELDIQNSERLFMISPSLKGFIIRSTADNPALVGKKIRATIAYKVRSGDSFSKWTIDDFNIENDKPKLDGCLLLESDGNFVTIEILSRKFKATWQGFDPLRDLDIKADFTESKKS